MAQPLLREAYEKRQEEGKTGAKEGELMSREEATAVLEDCMKVLYYRDARSLNKVRLACSCRHRGLANTRRRVVPNRYDYRAGGGYLRVQDVGDGMEVCRRLARVRAAEAVDVE